MAIEKVHDGYTVSLYHLDRFCGKQIIRKLYVMSVYNGQYTFCTDYTYAKHWKRLDTAMVHAQLSGGWSYTIEQEIADHEYIYAGDTLEQLEADLLSAGFRENDVLDWIEKHGQEFLDYYEGV